MALTHWTFIYYAPDADPERDSRTVVAGDLRNDLVALDDPAKLPEAAKQAVADGTQLIELCGAFQLLDKTWRDQAAEAIGNAVPVGNVRYSPEDEARVRSIAEG